MVLAFVLDFSGLYILTDDADTKVNLILNLFYEHSIRLFCRVHELLNINRLIFNAIIKRMHDEYQDMKMVQT